MTDFLKTTVTTYSGPRVNQVEGVTVLENDGCVVCDRIPGGGT